jgi:hypothetical protein
MPSALGGLSAWDAEVAVAGGGRAHVGDEAGVTYRSLLAGLSEDRNDRHASWVTTSAGPFGSFESRTATTPGRFRATSTQAPFWLLKVLLCHSARDRSICVIPHASLVLARPSW